MDVIDEDGRVFGVVNVIDLLVVLFVLALVAAGAVLVTSQEDTPQTDSNTTNTTNPTITVRAENVEPYVVDAIPAVGSLETSNVTRIENKSVEPSVVYVRDNSSGNLLEREHPRVKTVTLEVSVEATRQNGNLLFEQQPLKVGQSVSLDFGTVVLNGKITDVERSG